MPLSFEVASVSVSGIKLCQIKHAKPPDVATPCDKGAVESSIYLKCLFFLLCVIASKKMMAFHCEMHSSVAQ